jgi:outer membrane protein assembly factor BamA
MMKQILITLLLLMALSATVSAYSDLQEDHSVDLDYFEGRTITAIEYTGLNHTKKYVVTRELRSKVGARLDADLVRKDLVRLQNLPIFGAVSVYVTPDADGAAVEFVVSEIPWIIPIPAVDYSEENGFSFGAGVASINLFGRAQQLSGMFTLGGANTFFLAFRDPWIAGNRVSGGIAGGHTVRQNVLLGFEETKDLFQLSGGKWIGDSGRLGAHLGYVSVMSDKDGITLDPDNRDQIFYGGLILGYDNRDSHNSPRSGWHNEWINATYSGGDADFWGAQFDFNRYQPIGSNQSIAAGPILSLQSGEVGTDIPGYYQYFMGGSNSIRGYRLEELGRELYGKNQFLFNIEYRWNFIPLRDIKVFKWTISTGLQMACFVDAGLAWSHSSDFNLQRTRSGSGAGMRWLLPGVEMLRFDVGVSQYGDVVFNFGVQSIFSGRRQKVR